jgi:transcriptional regulator with XRE-family HTH domain
VGREYMNCWGKRIIDLRKLYDLRFKQKLSYRDLAMSLNLKKSTVIDNLRKARALYGNG